MSATTLEILEQRLAALEKRFEEMLRPPQPQRFKDWRQAVGLFPGDDFMKQIDEAGREIRAADCHEDEA